MKRIIDAARGTNLELDVNKDLLASLNPEQRRAAEHLDGASLIAAVAGAGKCVTGDTLVATPRGTMRIDRCRDITSVTSVDTTTLTTPTRDAYWLDMGEAPTLRITTKKGYQITGTPEHPLLVWRDGSAQWVRLDRMEEGDLIMIRPGYAIAEQDPGEVVSDQVAYLFGLLMGDARRQCHQIAWSRGGSDLPPIFFEILRSIGITDTKTYAKNGTLSVTHIVRDTRLSELCHEHDICLDNAKDKYIPEWLMGARTETRVAFLRGYFDTDGSCGDRGVEITSASHRLATDTHQMLLGLGVVSNLSPKRVSGYDHTYWRISISGPWLRIFRDRVGFLNATTKNEALASVSSPPSNPNDAVYPNLGPMLRGLLPQWKEMGRWDGKKQALDGVSVKSYFSGRRRPSAMRIIEMTEGCSGTDAALLRALTGYYLDPVSSIEDAGIQHVYDFTVPDTHSFLANGIVSHNTRVIVHRIAHLVQHHRINPSRILAVTFSKKGADEMNDRLKSMIGETEARVGTFHSLAYQVVRQEIPEYKGWTVDAKNKYKWCIKDACGFRELDWKGADLSFLQSFIGYAKNMLLRPSSTGAIELAHEWALRKGPKANARLMLAAYERAEELRCDRELITFDDMIFECVELFQKKDPIRARWANQWDYVVQDEAQDQNLGQLLIGEMLAQDHGNYQLVGDPAQAIYGFRGAQPSKLLGFEQKWGADVTLMGRNYRCGQVIIDLANKVLAAMDPSQRLDMEMICEKGTQGELIVREYQDLDDEGESIAERCLDLANDNVEWREMAVLYRTNAQSRAIEESMIGNRIPYRIIGGTNFYERREVKQLLSYLRCAAGRATLDDVTGCINAPFRFLGKAFVSKIRETAREARREARKAGVPVNYTDIVRETCHVSRVQSRQRNSAQEWADIIERANRRIVAARHENATERDKDAGKPARILEDIVRLTRYTAWLTKDEGEESVENNRVSNVRELIRAAERFPTVDELLQYISDILDAAKDQRSKGSPNKVTLTTMHRSKGMEWTSVFLCGINNDIIPHARAEDIEEERRLFYVGVTRAKDHLTISCIREAAIGARLKILSPSIFLEECGVDVDSIESVGADIPPHLS